MIWEEMLRRRVEERCGDPGEAFAQYGYRFGKWLDAEPARSDRDVAQVRDAVAGYLGGAVREGRLVGTAIGASLGVVGALVMFLLVWAVA